MSQAELMQRWEREQMLSENDREAIARARRSDWTEIDEDWAESEECREMLHEIIIRKYYGEELTETM